jgi:hypothetical protein
MKNVNIQKGDQLEQEAVFGELLKERQIDDKRPMWQLLRELFAHRHLRMATLLYFFLGQFFGEIKIILSNHNPAIK